MKKRSLREAKECAHVHTVGKSLPRVCSLILKQVAMLKKKNLCRWPLGKLNSEEQPQLERVTWGGWGRGELPLLSISVRCTDEVRWGGPQCSRAQVRGSVQGVQ